jgi:hypothetical protein
MRRAPLYGPALMDAGVPIAQHVGAISVGLVMDEEEGTGKVTRHELLSDIMVGLCTSRIQLNESFHSLRKAPGFNPSSV